jgi:hypothetical protein
MMAHEVKNKLLLLEVLHENSGENYDANVNFTQTMFDTKLMMQGAMNLRDMIDGTLDAPMQGGIDAVGMMRWLVDTVLQCTSTQQTIRMHHAFPERTRIALAQTEFKQIFINLAVNAVKYSTDTISIVVTIADRHFMLGVFSQSNIQEVQERTRSSQRSRWSSYFKQHYRPIKHNLSLRQRATTELPKLAHDPRTEWQLSSPGALAIEREWKSSAIGLSYCMLLANNLNGVVEMFQETPETVVAWCAIPVTIEPTAIVAVSGH